MTQDTDTRGWWKWFWFWWESPGPKGQLARLIVTFIVAFVVSWASAAWIASRVFTIISESRDVQMKQEIVELEAIKVQLQTAVTDARASRGTIERIVTENQQLLHGIIEGCK